MRVSVTARRGSGQAMQILLGIASLWTRTPTSTGLLPHKVDTYSPECVEQEFCEVRQEVLKKSSLQCEWQPRKV